MIAPRRFAALVLLAAVFSCAADYVGAGEPTADIQSRIAAVEKHLIPIVRIKGRAPGQLAERMRQIRVPGVSVAVINDYKIELVKGYGLAEVQAKTPVTPQTLFQAGSVSKPVAAMAALKLVEEGKLTLDGDVNRQLKSWKVPENAFTRKHTVDLRGILSHTAGLTVHGFPGYAVGRPIPTLPQILDGDGAANTRPVRVDKVPGHEFRYAGGGTTIMQQLVIDVTGRPFPEVMHDLVLSPLGMTSSGYEQPMPADRAARAASGYDRREKMIPGHWHIYPEMAAAGLWTTPSDVARYVIEVQLAHKGKSHKVLSQAMVEQMLTPQGGGEVGLGPFLAGKKGARRFEHGGSDAGFICEFMGYLDRGQGAVVMTNSDNGNRLVGEILGGISVVYGWPDFLSPEREPIAIDSKSLVNYQGTYSLGLFGQVQIERRGDRLFAKATAMGGEFELFFESATEFFTEDPGITGQFVRDGKGGVAEILVNQQIHAKKKS
jgi:CubicO group peptidase (beta-lactamase class C family)